MKKDVTNKIGYIYKLTNPIGKVYIGQTINKKQRKYHYNSGDFKQQIKLWYDVKKYNWNPADTFEIVEELICGENKSIINEREIYWINFFDSFKNGLNCNLGGDGNVGYSVSDETKKKMSLSKLGIKHPEWRNKQKSEYTIGRKHTAESKEKMSTVKKERMNDKIKEKISIGLIGNKNGLGNKGNRKKVLCLTNNIVYESIKEASLKLNIHETGIISVCRGKSKQTKGFKFKYYE